MSSTAQEQRDFEFSQKVAKEITDTPDAADLERIGHTLDRQWTNKGVDVAIISVQGTDLAIYRTEIGHTVTLLIDSAGVLYESYNSVTNEERTQIFKSTEKALKKACEFISLANFQK